MRVHLKDDEDRPALKEFMLDLVEMKKRLESKENLVVDGMGQFSENPQFGKSGVYLILKHIEQPLKYSTLDIRKIEADSDKEQSKRKSSIVQTNILLNGSLYKKSEININIEPNQWPTNDHNKMGDVPIQRVTSSTSAHNINDLDRIIMDQSLVTTQSRQLNAVNAISAGKMFGMNDVLQDWSGDVFERLADSESVFTRSLFNLPLRTQTVKDHGVISLIKQLVGSKDMMVAWDYKGPFESAQVPGIIIQGNFKKDFDYLLNSLLSSVSILEKLQIRICKGKQPQTDSSSLSIKISFC